MLPQPTERYGLIRVPAHGATAVVCTVYAPLAQRDTFDPASWPIQALTESAVYPGWWEFNIDALKLNDGVYEYEFLLNRSATPVPDPYTDEITRFAGYRGLFRISGQQRLRQVFSWDGEFSNASPLEQNNQIVVYKRCRSNGCQAI